MPNATTSRDSGRARRRVSRRPRRDVIGVAVVWASLLAFATPSPAADAESGAAPETWYAAAFSKGERNFLVTHYWSSGSRLRSETVIAGHRIVTIVSGDTYYAIDQLSGTGIAIARPPRAVREDATRGRPFAPEFARLLEGGGERVRTENMGGIECDLYRLTDDSGRRQVCVSQSDPPIPVHVETFNRKSGRTDTVSYLNWMRGLRIPDRFFAPEAGIQLEQMAYEEYRTRSRKGDVGPVPVLYGALLHGRPAR